MKYIEEYLMDAIKVEPLGELTTMDDNLYGMSGEMVYIDGKCSDIFISHADYVTWLEKQGEYQPADKVEPKFKVGDWVVFNNHHNSVYQVEKIENYEYTLRHFLGGSMPLSFSHADMIRVWTIADAKPGDVIVDKSDGVIGIFQSIGHRPNYCFLHCRYDDDYFYADFDNGNMMDSDDVIPATKEQRDLLFQKMKESDYKWENKKKRIEKIEHSLALSEEDRSKIQRICKYLNESKKYYADITDVRECIDWLKSLRPQSQWKPSKEQMGVLANACDGKILNLDYLNSLYQDLKKLREE